jgi:hypothetical protein
VRIAGLVTASNRVREQLKIGISAQHVDRFRQSVLTTLQTTEQLCASAQMTPAQLPTPSRKAYAFLKQLDLNHLPIADASVPESVYQTIALKNVRGQQEYIQSQFSKLIGQMPDGRQSLSALHSRLTPAKIQPLYDQLLQKGSEIEKICSHNGLSPSHLAEHSKSFYAWIQYLLEDRHLLSHLEAMQRFGQIIQTYDRPPSSQGFHKSKAQSSVKPVMVELTNMAALYRFRSTPKTIEVELCEGFIAADNQVWKALAQTIRSGKAPHTTNIIKQFSRSEEFSEVLLALDLLVGEITDTAQGHAYNLETIFHTVRQDYFDAAFQKPQLAWSKSFTHRKYGHYEPARDRVVLSCTLDDSNIPSYVAEFVMYHELLHKRHGEVWVNGRQRVHTPAFRRDERQFKQYDLAEAFLQKLARQ